MNKNKTIRVIIGLCVVAGAAILVVLLYITGLIALPLGGTGRPAPVSKPTFDGDSRALKATQVVATLDAPLEKGKNAVWCASFISAWKALEADIVKEPPTLQGSPAMAAALNKAADPRPEIPKSSLYTAAGWVNKGIVEQITKDFRVAFPGRAEPEFKEVQPDSAVAYAYLEAAVKFKLPYFQNDQPFVFTDSSSHTTELNSFGIRSKDDYAYERLRQQPAILFSIRGNEYRFQPTEYAVDLDRTSKPVQIVLAVIKPQSTLAAMMESVEAKIAASGRRVGDDGLGPRDVLLAPDIAWRISHHFAELEGKDFANAALKGRKLKIAQQDIEFHLNRSGAELWSEAKVYVLPMDTHFLFDRPFLLYMKQRGARTPFFVMWVENAELLSRWQPD
jgi:hypothetical protein